MDQAFKISFIVTAYNLPAGMLRECIESIMAIQLQEDEREVIVVDDGSDEPVVNELDDYRDAIVYVRQSNQGVSVARNTGIRMATGTYIQFVDGDDRLLKIPYEYCIQLVRQQQADVVMFGMTDQAENRTELKHTAPVDGSTFMRHNNITGAVWSYLFKRSLLLTLRFTKGIEYGEDEEFTPQILLRAEHVIKTPAEAYFYRQHASSALHQATPERKRKRLDDNIRVIERLHYLACTGNESDREALQRRVAQLTMDYIYHAITLTKDFKYLESRIQQLYDKGLFPLPDRDYTQKYKWFRKMTMTKTGRKLLCTLLPKLP